MNLITNIFGTSVETSSCDPGIERKGFKNKVAKADIELTYNLAGQWYLQS